MDQLLHLRPTCGAVVVSKKKKCPLREVKCVLPFIVKMGKNIGKREPKLKGMAARNLLLPLAIPLSGAAYTRMALLSEIVNLKISGKRQLTTLKT